MWQQTLVVVWLQFAIGAMAILVTTSLALRWIAQPAERARLILLMLAAVVVLPIVSALAPFRSWNLGLISRARIASVPVAEAVHDPSGVWAADRPADSSAEVPSGVPVAMQRNAASPLVAGDDQPLTRAEPPASALSRPLAIGLRLASIDAWWVLAWAIVLAHVAAAIYILTQRAIGKARLRRLCRAASDAPETVDRAWQAIAGNRAHGVRLLVSSEVEAPLVFGWLRPVVLIPQQIAAENSRALACCLAHEWSHIERSDLLSWWFVNICQFVLWYQPVFWTLRRELRICQEFLADNRSARGAVGSIEYSELLLGLAKRRRGPGVVGALTMFDQPSQLARRIRMLLDDHVPLSLHCRRPFTCCVLAFAALLATAASAVRVDSIQADVEAAQAVAPATPPAATADTEKPVAHMITYTEQSSVTDQKQSAKTRVFVAEDGRKRSELSVGIAISIHIFDATGCLRITLMEPSKTAMVQEAAEDQGRYPRKSFMEWFSDLRKTSGKLVKELGKKELDGKHVSGFVATQSELTYTVWTDDATGLPVRIDTDFPGKGTATHQTMTDFRFDEQQDESLFSFAVPAGYKLWKAPAVATVNEGKEKPPVQRPANLELAWSREGQWVGVAAVRGESAVYGIYRLQSVIKLNEKGEELATTRLVSSDFHIRAAALSADKKCDFITFTSGTVTAYSPDEKVLWYYSKEGGLGDVCAVDLNNDAADEAILCYTGAAGIHALDNTGKLLWKNTDFGNVWHVAAGNIDGDARPEILAVSAAVHVLDAEGKHLRDLNPGFYVEMVRVWENAVKDKSAAVIVVAGTDASKKTTVAGLNPQGTTQWSFDPAARVVNAVTSGDKPWLALTLADGGVRVIDVVAGKEIGQIGNQGERADTAWLPVTDGVPLLVVATGNGLNAYRVPTAQP
ncbi:MAG TPA: M56 family metallopeptidase [Pirellulales bacterium]|nr:M56 family metallopeptidase [Pirellulales bacterium]